MIKKEKQRRRGDDLLESIFSKTKELISEHGYPNITIQMIAQKAETSRAVIYRRWSSTFDIIVAMIDYKKKEQGGSIIDRVSYTGDLRKDLIQLLTIHNSLFIEIGSEILKAYFYEIGMKKDSSSKQATDMILKDNMLIMNKILEEAKLKGEKIKKTNKEMLALPFNIIRINNIFWETKMSTKRIETIVDTILIPVFKTDRHLL